MKAQRFIPSALLCVTVAVGGPEVNDVSAQNNTATSTSNARITVIGCIRRSQPVAADSVGTTLIPAGETHYLLSNITLVPPDGHKPAGEAGSAASLLTEAVSAYRLDDSAPSPIASHVGDRVQVTGRIVPTPPLPTGTAGRTQIDATPILRVESLQKLSSDSTVCSQETDTPRGRGAG